jgi:GNAT superfamily N-acetyltransferase
VAEESVESGSVAGPEAGEGIGEAAAARAGGTLLGWIHVAGQYCLEAEPWAEILGLVVDEDRRRRGVGCELLRCAERWARERGYRRLRLRTNVVRVETHAFYRRRGFEELKTQHVFVRDLPSLAESGSNAGPTG